MVESDYWPKPGLRRSSSLNCCLQMILRYCPIMKWLCRDGTTPFPATTNLLKQPRFFQHRGHSPTPSAELGWACHTNGGHSNAKSCLPWRAESEETRSNPLFQTRQSLCLKKWSLQPSEGLPSSRTIFFPVIFELEESYLFYLLTIR